jgi:hypothetical protein
MSAEDAKLVALGSGPNVDCRYDENTGILHITLSESSELPSEGDLLELIAHHRAGREITGIVIFPRGKTEWRWGELHLSDDM